MSVDGNMRKLEREGDSEALARARSRAGDLCLADRLRKYVGKWLYIEGARMNYMIKLTEVVGWGRPDALVYDQGVRVGDYNSEGMIGQYCAQLPASADMPRMLPWGAVDDVGLAPKRWVDQLPDIQKF